MKTLKEKLCLKCKKCCNEITIATGYPADKEILEFFTARGFRISIIKNTVFLTLTNFPCPHLKDNGCDIYKDRPSICKNYDGRNEFGNECLWSNIADYKHCNVCLGTGYSLDEDEENCKYCNGRGIVPCQ